MSVLCLMLCRMDENTFWQFIDECRPEGPDPDAEGLAEALVGRLVGGPVSVVVGFADGKVAFERIYWDQASVLVQLGLLERAGLPVTGAEQAAAVRDPTTSHNALIRDGGIT